MYNFFLHPANAARVALVSKDNEDAFPQFVGDLPRRIACILLRMCVHVMSVQYGVHMWRTDDDWWPAFQLGCS